MNDLNPGYIKSITIGTSLTFPGQLNAGSIDTMTIGPNMLATGDDMAGLINVLGKLLSLTVAGGTPGNITAGLVGTIATYGGYGPYVLQVNENGIQRRVEAAVPGQDYPLFRFPPLMPTPPISPVGVTIQFFYEGLASAIAPANPQLTARVTNTAPLVDEFDLSLTVWSDTAKFNLARLDAVGQAGIRNGDFEGDVLTSVSTAAISFYPPTPINPAGVYLPADMLASVGVQGNVTAGAVAAKSIQAVAFGSLTDATGTTTAPNAKQVQAQEVFATGTAIVQAKDTFRVPFADNVPVAFFLDTNTGGVLDNKPVLFTDQGAIATQVTQIPDVRGAVTSLVTATIPGPSSGSNVTTIAMTGDGGAIQTAQDSIQTINSTGPLGDVTMSGTHGLTANITAPSILGNIIAANGMSGIDQTTGVRTDPITGTQGPILADFGRPLKDASNNVTGVTIVQCSGSGISGQLISRHNFYSSISASGGINAVVAGQGDLGLLVVDAAGHLTRFGSVLSSGSISGDIVFLGNIFADIAIPHGGLKAGRIAAQGQLVPGLAASRTGILGNLTFSGDVDGSSAIVSGGEIGDPTSGTGLSVSNVHGILAANGGINILSANLKGAAIFANATGTINGKVINSIFAPGAFDLVGFDLKGLAAILTNLNNLHVGSDGNLTIVPFMGKNNGQSLETTGTAGSGTAELQTVGWSSSVGAPIILGVYVANPDGTLTADEHVRIDDAIATLDQTWTGTVGLDLVEVSDPSQATIVISNSLTSPAGSQADGVLGCTSLTYSPAVTGAMDEGVPYLQFTGQAVVNILEGWNWYTGSDPTQMGAGQFDYQSVASHELGHSVGLYHDVSTYGSLNSDGHSAMYPVLNSGDIHRQLSPYDISWLNHLYANGENPGGNDGPESVAALMAGALPGSFSLQFGVNERSQMPLLSETTFRSPRDIGSFPPASITGATGVGSAWSPASLSTAPGALLPLDPSAGWIVMNGRIHDAMAPANVSTRTNTGLPWATDSVSNVELYSGLTASQEMDGSAVDTWTYPKEVNPVIVPDQTSDSDRSRPAGVTGDVRALSRETQTIWNYDASQFSTEDQLAGSIRDTLFSSCDILGDSAGAPLAALALVTTLLPRRQQAEIGRRRPDLRF